jgi:hypothetical protein
MDIRRPAPLPTTTPALARPTTAPAATPAATPSTVQAQVQQRVTDTMAGKGTLNAAQAAQVPTSSGGPVKGGVLGFRLAQMAEVPLHKDESILAHAANNPSMKALLQLRVNCPEQYAPHVEVVRADGSTVAGSVKGVNAKQQLVIDTGFGKTTALPMSETLQAVRHQMDTDGDLHTALVSVFNTASHVSDPWQLQGFAGKALNIETFDAEHTTLAAAAKKGDVSSGRFNVAGANAEGIALTDGGTLLKEHWQIAKITVDQPAYSYKADGMRLSDVGTALAPGTEVTVKLPGNKRDLVGTFVGVAKDAEGSDYIVVSQGNTRHALRDVVDVTSKPVTHELWRHDDYSSVYVR